MQARGLSVGIPLSPFLERTPQPNSVVGSRDAADTEAIHQEEKATVNLDRCRRLAKAESE
jgi:hypothetical protein